MTLFKLKANLYTRKTLLQSYKTQSKSCTPGPNDLKTVHPGQVCTLCTFSHQTLHTALDTCLDIVTSYLMTSQKRGIKFSNFKPPNISSERAWLWDSNTENRSSLWQIFLALWQLKEIVSPPPPPPPRNHNVPHKLNPLIFFLQFPSRNSENLVILST